MGYPIFHSQYTAAQIEASIGKTPRIKASTRTWEIWDIATSAYVDSGVSIDTQLYVDPTLTESGYAADAKVTGDEIGELKSALGAVADVKLLNGFTELTEPGYYGSGGDVIASSSFVHSEVYVEVKPNTEYSLWWARYATSYASMAYSCGVCFYDADKAFISRAANTHTFTTPSACKYIRTYLSKDEFDTYAYSMLTEGTTAPTYFIPYGYDVITAYEEKCGESYDNSFSNELKLIDALTIADGTKEYTLDSETSKTATTGHYTNAIGVVKESALWNTYRCNIEPNAKYYVKASAASGAYAITVFDKKGKRLLALPSTLANSTLDGMIDTPAAASYAILNASTSITASLKKVIGIRLSTTADTSANVLFEKKLYCGGDSITAGANVGTFPNGYKKTYGGYMATRNGMTYVADGVGGSTMGKCTIDGTAHNNFITSRYQNIPTDADYITLWFGWNDNAYGWISARDAYCVETYGTYYSALTAEQKTAVDNYKTWRQWAEVYVGSIDSTDINTWSGAWNTVLTWLLNNCPSAHIGVVIAYGMLEVFATSLISICEKYGVAYVKAYDPHEFFSVGHSEGIGTDQATKRKELYTLDNTHPNELGYELMSTSYEQFVRRM